MILDSEKQIVGRVLARHINRRFKDTDEKQILQVVHFDPDEMISAIRFFNTELNLSGTDSEQGFRIYVTDSYSFAIEKAKLPNAMVIADNQSRVALRNSPDSHKYVIFVSGEQSDKQSFGPVSAITDVVLLDYGSTEDRNLSIEELIEEAWYVDSLNYNVPESLRTNLIDIISKVFSERKPGIRQIARYAKAVVSAPLIQQGPTLTTLRETVLSYLYHLEMFPDEEAASLSDAQINGRIKKNLAAADGERVSGGELDLDALAVKSETQVFQNPKTGLACTDEQNKRWRELCRSYCLSRNPDERKDIPWAIFSQLLETRESQKLGDIFLAEIVENAPEREPELNALDVCEGLNQRQPAAAKKLLDAEASPEDQSFLIDHVSKSTRTKVENLANRADEVYNFPTWLLKELYQNPLPDDEKYEITLDLSRKNEGQYDLSKALFSFLYGDLLINAANACDKSVVTFQFGSGILDKNWCGLDGIREINDKRREAEDEQQLWPDLPLRLTINKTSHAGKDVKEEFYAVSVSWNPKGRELLSFFMLEAADEVMSEIPAFSPDPQIDSEEWFRKVSEGQIDFEKKQHPSDDLISEWGKLRKSFLTDLRKDGLTASRCETYFAEWNETVLNEAKKLYRLQGSPDEVFSMFMSFDTVAFEGSWFMLPSHPLRVRWIGKFLQEITELLPKAISGSLSIVRENDQLFLNVIKSLSPHQQPPYFVTPLRKKLKPVEEIGWAEKYLSIDGDSQTEGDWLSTVDDEAISCIAEECRKFIEFHPYKSSGVDILVVIYAESGFVEKLIRRLLDKELKSRKMCIRMHIVAPKLTLQACDLISASTSELYEVHSDYQLFPPLQMNVYPWDSRSKLSSIFNEKNSIDIAIVPNLFVRNVQVNPQAGQTESESTAFHPLYSMPTRQVAAGEKAINLNIDLLPNNDDQALYNWSSLSVMLSRSDTVSDDDTAVEFFRIQIDVARSQDLFQELHQLASWVVTLDTYISRRHIESLPCRPEVITFQEGIGKNGAYNMVISSTMGAQFIIPRLRAKIFQYFEDRVPKERLHEISETLYRESCSLSPGLVLRALGGGWTLNEIMGLVCTRRYLNNMANRNLFSTHGTLIMNSWIALDNQLQWFSKGGHNKRADLLWARLFKQSSGRLALSLCVVESKFGSRGLGRLGATQASQTKDLIASAFRPDSEKRDDGRLWRESLLRAIENSDADLVLQNQRVREAGLSDVIRNDICSGALDIYNDQGLVVCHCLEEGVASEEEIDGIRVMYTDKNDIISLLSEIREHSDGSKTVTEDIPVTEVEVSFNKDALSDPLETDCTVAEQSLSSAETEEAPRKMEMPKHEKVKLYSALLDRLTSLKVDMRLPKAEGEMVMEGPTFLRFKLDPAPSTTLKKIRSVAEELQRALQLAESESVRIFQAHGIVWLEAPKPTQYRRVIGALEAWVQFEANYNDKSKLIAPVGLDMEGNVISIDFTSSNSPHLLIAGMTGAGKSVALNTILKGMVRYQSSEQLRLHLIDPKGNELIDFEDSEHIDGTIESTPEKASLLLEKAVKEMEYRYGKFRELKASHGSAAKDLYEYNKTVDESSRLPRWVVVLDEYADLISERENKKIIEGLLQRLCQKARAAGIHVILATQKPLATVIGSVVKSNLPAVLALKVGKGTDSQVILDEVGAESLVGKGDALFKDGSGATIRLQCAKSE